MYKLKRSIPTGSLTTVSETLGVQDTKSSDPEKQIRRHLWKWSITLLFSGQTIPLWTGVPFNVTNWTALITWPEPPNSFLRNATVEKYELISGKETTKIFYVKSFPQSGREFLITGLRPLSNYTGKIIAELSDGRRGSTHWIGFRTKEGSKFGIVFYLSSLFIIGVYSFIHTIAPMEFRSFDLAFCLHFIYFEVPVSFTPLD